MIVHVAIVVPVGVLQDVQCWCAPMLQDVQCWSAPLLQGIQCWSAPVPVGTTVHRVKNQALQ